MADNTVPNSPVSRLNIKNKGEFQKNNWDVTEEEVKGNTTNGDVSKPGKDQRVVAENQRSKVKKKSMLQKLYGKDADLSAVDDMNDTP